MILLDTNVVSGLMRPAVDRPLAAWLASLDDQLLGVSTVSIGEIAYGVARLPAGRRKSLLAANVERLIGGMEVIDFDRTMAAQSGVFRNVRAVAGRPMSFADAMIGGTAAALGAVLATRNIRDFDGLGLSLVDPWTG